MLLRLANLGYQDHAFTFDNIDLTVVAKDASLLEGRDGTTNYQTTNTVDIGPGESRDVIFTAPDKHGHLPALRPQVLVPRQRRRRRLRRHDDRDPVKAGTPAAQTSPNA